MGDTGVLVALRLARSCDVTGVATRPALVSGQELGTRLTDPAGWARSYFVPFVRFRRLDGVRTLHGRVTSVDPAASVVHVALAGGGTEALPYDALVIATGASNGFWRHDRVEDLAEIEAGMAAIATEIGGATTIAVVGGGPTGASVADNLARRTSSVVHLFHSGDLPLPEYHPRVRSWVAGVLRRDGVTVHPGHRALLPEGFTGDGLTHDPVEWSTGQPPFAPDLVVWAVGKVRPHTAFLPPDMLDDDGFVRVDEHLRVPGHASVFAVGDVAASDPLRCSARNWGWRVVTANVGAHLRGRGRLRRFRAPRYRWGSILGLHDEGLVIAQPNGRRVRIPRALASRLLYRGYIPRYLYGGLRRAVRAAEPVAPPPVRR